MALVHLDLLGLPGLGVAAPVLLVSVGLAGLMASLGRLTPPRPLGSGPCRDGR